MEGFLEERQEHPTGHGTYCAWPVGHSEDPGEFFVRQISEQDFLWPYLRYATSKTRLATTNLVS